MHSAVPTYFTDKMCYFAAANGYTGFRSYFGEMFTSDRYDRIFVLKGGPGTGKSRLIRNVGTIFEGRGCYTEWVFCGSDPTSLDGVRLCYGGKEVAILDGTAPHERDAVVAGAVDTLVNLGDGWDESVLIQRRPDILTLSAAKARAYEKAYEYLHICSEYASKIKAEAEKMQDEEALRFIARTLLADVIPHDRSRLLRRAVRSFCRYGSVVLPTYEHMADRLIYPVCHPFVRPIFMRILTEEAMAHGAHMYRAPSPLCEEDTDALLFPEERMAVLGYTPTNEALAEPLLLPEGTPPDPYTALLDEVQGELLLRAQNAFSLAADAHAHLEELYIRAMNFSKNDERTADITACIERIFY